MHFANPGFLWAFFFLLIPIAIHLFKFRRYKRVDFPSLRFLKQIDEEQKAKRRLKDILILISRLLALSALILAFAQPNLGDAESSSKGNVVSIYIDNSFSMENESDQGMLLDLAKNKVAELAMSFSASDQFQLLTNDLEARHQRIVDRQAFLQFIYEIDLSATTLLYSDVYERQIAMVNEMPEHRQWICLISDFQRSTIDLENFELKEEVDHVFLRIEPKSFANVYIDSVWFDAPLRQLGANEELFFRIRNRSNDDLDELAIQLDINEQLKSIATISIKAGAYKDTSIQYLNEKESGQQLGVLTIEDKPISFDNDYFFSYELKDKIKVGLINSGQGNPYYEVIFQDSLFDADIMDLRRLDVNRMRQNDFIVLDGLNEIPSGLASFLLNWTEEGGQLLISPGDDINLEEYRKLYSSYDISIAAEIDTNERRVDRLELQNELYAQVFKRVPQGKGLPNTFKHYVHRYQNMNWQSLFTLQGGDPFLSTRSFGKGRLFVLCVPSDEEWSNWSKHALFVTSVYRMAEESQRIDRIEHRIGDWNLIEVKSEVRPESGNFELKAHDASLAFVPSQQWSNNVLNLGIKDEISKAGFYDVYAGEQNLKSLAFNYSRLESDLEFIGDEELEIFAQDRRVNLLSNEGPRISKASISNVQSLWKAFLILLLIALIIEVLIIKLMS